MWSYGWYFHGHQQDSLIRIFLCILHILGRVYNKIVAYYAPTYTALHKLILIPIKAQTQKLKEMY